MMLARDANLVVPESEITGLNEKETGHARACYMDAIHVAIEWTTWGEGGRFYQAVL